MRSFTLIFFDTRFISMGGKKNSNQVVKADSQSDHLIPARTLRSHCKIWALSLISNWLKSLPCHLWRYLPKSIMKLMALATPHRGFTTNMKTLYQSKRFCPRYRDILNHLPTSFSLAWVIWIIASLNGIMVAFFGPPVNFPAYGISQGAFMAFVIFVWISMFCHVPATFPILSS